jgi:hypothetical protein
MSAKGIHHHERFKLGKDQPRKDPRDFRFAALLRPTLPRVPPSYDFDAKHPSVPLPMLANDRLGCCVISSRGHQTLRFEDVEQKQIVSISDSDIEREYFSETGGPDEGLVIAESLDQWRKSGWRLSGKGPYKIMAYASVNVADLRQVKLAIMAGAGVCTGFDLPISAADQIDANKKWSIVRGRSGEAGSWGGHCVMIASYNSVGPICVTWSQRQQMSWGFFSRYCDECFSVIDASNSFAAGVIDPAKVDEHLSNVTKAAA